MTRLALALAASLAAALVPASASAARAPEASTFARVATVELVRPDGRRAGTVTLAGAGRVTAVRYTLAGLGAGTTAVARVRVGTRLATAGAAVASLPRVAADRRGRAFATGFATAGGRHLTVEAVADGAHLVVLANRGRVVAWGRIPPAGA